jgi:hypothetical protein
MREGVVVSVTLAMVFENFHPEEGGARGESPPDDDRIAPASPPDSRSAARLSLESVSVLPRRKER